MNGKIHVSICLSPLLFAALAFAETPPSVGSVVQAMRQVRTFPSVEISPDGARVAWVENVEEKDAPEARHSAIWIAPVSGGPPVRVTAGSDGKNHRELAVAWSPDGKSLAFLSDAAQLRQLEVYVASASGGPPRQITKLTGQLGHLQWSPDGRSIAFLFIEGSTQEPGALVPYEQKTGAVEEKIEEQRIAIADVATENVRPVSPANLYVYEYDWSSDGKIFAATAAEGSGTNNYWIARLYTVRADTGETKAIWRPPLQIADPAGHPMGNLSR